MANNWKKIFARKKAEANRLLKLYPDLTNNSGIYVFTRFEENGSKYTYIGQAKHLLDRLVSHLINYSQRIEISLKKRGLAPKGEWHLEFKYCDESELDKEEEEQIDNAIKAGFVIYNITSGGQGVGKVDINERKPAKTYTDGVKYGYEKCRKEITELFDKYLIVSIDPKAKRKDGEYLDRAIKAWAKFTNFLKGKDIE